MWCNLIICFMEISCYSLLFFFFSYADVFSVSIVIDVFFSISRRKWNHWNKKQQMKDSSLWRLTWHEWKPCWMTVGALLWRTTSQPCRLCHPGWVWYHSLCQLGQNCCSCPGGSVDVPRCSPALEPAVCSLCKSWESSQTVCLNAETQAPHVRTYWWIHT